MSNNDKIALIVQNLYALVEQLEAMFPGRRFTPDGHLVGSIGEVLAADRYGLRLLPASSKSHDAVAPSGVQVQIKATQGASIGMRSECEHLIVMFIQANGTAEEMYNGPGGPPWASAGKMQKNGQRPITISKLFRLMTKVPPSERLPVVGS